MTIHIFNKTQVHELACVGGYLWKPSMPEVTFCLSIHFMWPRRKGQRMAQKAEQGASRDNRWKNFFQRAKLGYNQGSFQFHLTQLHHCPGVSPYFIFKMGKLIAMILLLLYLVYRISWEQITRLLSSYILAS